MPPNIRKGMVFRVFIAWDTYNVHTHTHAWWKRNAQIASDYGNKVNRKNVWTDKQTLTEIEREEPDLEASTPPTGACRMLFMICVFITRRSSSSWSRTRHSCSCLSRPWNTTSLTSSARAISTQRPTAHTTLHEGRRKKKGNRHHFPGRNTLSMHRTRESKETSPQSATTGSKSHLGGDEEVTKSPSSLKEVKSLSTLAGILTKHQHGHQLAPTTCKHKQP